MTPTLFPPSTWQVVTDVSERDSGSESKGNVRRQGALHTFQGTLGHVEGRRGPVGFLKVTFSALEPVRRGRNFRAEPDLSDVRTVGFTVRRSVQMREVRNGPPLNFEIHFEERGPLGQLS